ncbi:hypothetical protein M407DRAFT_29305 [Tulasnella calospora MUT 4182]|uniref:Uncharacterized protein n=1 Tax=Tulasnella calospora MUT 4182 TaxID=1051891 RepID=A0A0C3LI26_9AGAM|nr:hypothetical protein M407DRAFT_29305 [Tulasnella calospora MUT 4182]
MHILCSWNSAQRAVYWIYKLSRFQTLLPMHADPDPTVSPLTTSAHAPRTSATPPAQGIDSMPPTAACTPSLTSAVNHSMPNG